MKNNTGLVEHAKKALSEKWGYVWGTFGQVLSSGLLAYKVSQYPAGVGNYEDFIKGNWLGRRTADCVGLIKSYMWCNGAEPEYSSATDVSADGMYYAAKEKGPMNTMPEIPGLCLWKPGHIGIYIGFGLVIEAHGTHFGVIQTSLSGDGSTGWTHWLKCPYITYDGAAASSDLYLSCTGDAVKALQRKLNKIGYKLDDDGIFGGLTKGAVMSFQFNNSLKDTGVVDDLTMKAIDIMVARVEGPKKKTCAELIREVSEDPDAWENSINVAVKAAEAEGDLGALERFKFLPELIEKIGNKR